LVAKSRASTRIGRPSQTPQSALGTEGVNFDDGDVPEEDDEGIEIDPQVDEDLNLDPLLYDDVEVTIEDPIGGLRSDGTIVGGHENQWNEVEIQEFGLGLEEAKPAFLGDESGPINIPEDSTTPLDFFRLFFDDEIMVTFVTATNEFGSFSSGPASDDFPPVTVEELLKFFGCLLYMGVYTAPSTREHFATKPSWAGSKFCKKSFSGRRLLTNSRITN